MADGLLLEVPLTQYPPMIPPPFPVVPQPIIVPLTGRELIAAERGVTLVKCDDDIRQIEKATRDKHESDSLYGGTRQHVNQMSHATSVARVMLNSSIQALEQTERSHQQVAVEVVDTASAVERCEGEYELACGLLHTSDTIRLELQSEFIRKRAALDDTLLELQNIEASIERSEQLHSDAVSESMRLSLQNNELESKRSVIGKRLAGEEKRLEQAKCSEFLEETQTRDIILKQVASGNQSVDLKAKIARLQTSLAAAVQKHRSSVLYVEDMQRAEQAARDANQQQDSIVLDASANLMAVETLEESPRNLPPAAPIPPATVPDNSSVDITSPEAAAARDLLVEQLMSRHRVLKSKIIKTPDLLT